MSAEIIADKNTRRRAVRQSRKAMPDSLRALTTAAITDHLEQLVNENGAQTIACFLSSSTEPQTRPFIDWATQNNLTVLLPISTPEGDLDWAVATGNESIGLHNMPEPIGPRLGADALKEVDLLVIPAASIDRTGMRLGWGKGYYDRALAKLGKKVPVYAVIFDDEFVEKLPYEEHDYPVTGVITPRTIVTF